VAHVTEDLVLRIRGRRYTLEGLDHERCTACGERIFGIEASRQIDGVVLSRRRRVA
jgi:YgiT-type zinc finger domain-containing protein